MSQCSSSTDKVLTKQTMFSDEQLTELFSIFDQDLIECNNRIDDGHCDSETDGTEDSFYS